MSHMRLVRVFVHNGMRGGGKGEGGRGVLLAEHVFQQAPMPATQA